MYDAAGNRVLLHARVVPRGGGDFAQLVLAPDYRRLYAATTAGRVFVIDPETLAVVAGLDWHLTAVNALAVSPDGEWLATAGAEGGVKLWPVRRLLG